MDGTHMHGHEMQACRVGVPKVGPREHGCHLVAGAPPGEIRVVIAGQWKLDEVEIVRQRCPPQRFKQTRGFVAGTVYKDASARLKA